MRLLESMEAVFDSSQSRVVIAFEVGSVFWIHLTLPAGSEGKGRDSVLEQSYWEESQKPESLMSDS